MNNNKNDDFILLSKTEKTIDYINKQLINYPKTEIILKNNIEKTMYNLMENIFSYRIENLVRIKMKYLKSLIINLSMLDYYMRVSFKKKIISSKRYNSIANFIIEIRKLAYGVIRSEKNNS